MPVGQVEVTGQSYHYLPNRQNAGRGHPAPHEITEGIDLDCTGMQGMIREFLREAARSQVAIVYYAGHGVQIDGRNYLVPVDAPLRQGAPA